MSRRCNWSRRCRTTRRGRRLPKILLDFGEPLSDEQAAWFTKRLSKPIKRHHLQAFLLECTGNQLTRTKSRVTLPLQAMPLAQEIPLRILLAEDNHINQKVAVALLARFGYRVDVAGNGMEAFESVMRQTYDIVFLDIQMPEMDGIQAAHAIRERLRERCPKLVALTANAFPGGARAVSRRRFRRVPEQAADSRFDAGIAGAGERADRGSVSAALLRRAVKKVLSS